MEDGIVGRPEKIGNRSMRWKTPHEDPNTGHAVAVDVRDTEQLMPSC